MILKTILLAEDNPNDIELTLYALNELHLSSSITVVNDGVEVLEYLRCQKKFMNRQPGHPAMILLDIKMPRMNGIEALKEIRKDPVLKMIPVVMLSSSKENQDILKTYSLGVNAYVVKPLDFKQFVDAIKQLGSFWAILNEPPPN